jgi:hypothetical protein
VSRIAIALPYAVSIRDFVHGGALAELLADRRHALTIYTLNPDLPELAPARALGVPIRVLAGYDDTRVESLVKRLYPMFFADRFAYVEQGLIGKPARRLLAGACVAWRKLVGAPALLRMVGGMLLRLYRRRQLPRQLDADLDLLIGTRSLINSLDYGLMAEAAVYGVPTVTLAGSWDNFTTKGYFPFPVRKTVVWNAKMRDELIDLFGVQGERIAIAGYPRASLLRQHTAEVDLPAYLQSLGVPGFRRFVLYSASYSELTRVPGEAMPLEYLAIRKVCEALVPQLPPDVCVLIRLHPFSKQEDQACFEGLSRCHVFVPGRQDRYVERVMDNADERHLAQQIGLSECVVSMASTMSIDTMCLGKPIINIAFDPVPGLPFIRSIRRFYDYNHFSDLVRIARLPLARDPADVVRFVTECLVGSQPPGADLVAFERMYVPESSNQYPQRVHAAVEEALTR